MNLAGHLWQSTLFAAAVALLNWTLRRKRARVRHGLWLAASAKFLLPFSVLLMLGGHIPWRTALRTAPSGFSAVMAEVSEPFSAAASATLPRAAHPLPSVLWSIWAVGFLGIACSWWVRWRRIAAAARAGSTVPLGLPLRAVSCATLMEPGVFGIVRPVLLLPAGIFERLSRAQLQAVIAHELYHVRHRDNLAAVFQMFVETVFWFHPMVWWMGRRMVEERERACDEAVLRAGSEPRIYAEAILNVCRFYTESRLAFVPGVSGANLRKRIEAIMNNNVASDLRPLQKFALALAGAAAVTLPILAGMVHLPALRAQSAAAPPTQAEREWRIQYARATFGNLAMVRTYTEYGRPDQIRDGNSDPRHLSQIWHYNYLADFHGSAEFEFAPPGRGSRMRIDFPPPLATFTAGSGRASIAVYTSKQDVTLTVPLDSLSGQVEMIGQVASNGRSVANVRDSVTAGPGAAQAQWQASFTLDPGSYSCHLLVREASGQLYAESIPFEVTK